MADKIVEEIEIRADAAQGNRAAADFEKALTGAFVKSQIAMQAAHKVLDLFVENVEKGIASAKEFERTTIARNIALEAQNRNVERGSQLLEIQANTLERLTAVSDEQIRHMQTQALNYGVSVERIDDLIRASISLANVTGMDVNQAMIALTKTQEGYVDRTISKLIPGMSNLTDAQLRNGDAIELVNQRYSKFLDLNTQGGFGTMERLGTEWDNFGEAVAKALGKVAMKAEEATGVVHDLTSALSLASRFMDEGDMGMAFAALFGAGNEGRRNMAAGLAREDAASAAALKAAELASQRTAGGGFDLTGQSGQNPMTIDAPGKAKKSSGAGGTFVDRIGNVSPEAAAQISAFDEMEKAKSEVLEQEIQRRIAFEKEHGERVAAVNEGRAERAAAIEDQITETAETNEKRRTEIAAEQAERRGAAVAAAQKRYAHEQEADMNRLAGTSQQAFGMVASTAIDAFESMAEGASVSGEAMTGELLKGVGKLLLGRGAADAIEAVARGIRSYGGDPTAYTLGAIAAGEIALGAGMLAGGAALTPGHGGGGHGGGGGAGYAGGNIAVGGGFAGGGDSGFIYNDGHPGDRTQGFSVSQRGGMGNRQITIHVDGIMSPAETGQWVRRALEAAEEEGR